MDSKIIISIVTLLLLVVAASGCTSTSGNVTNNTTSGSLQNDISISNVTITKAGYGDGYDITLVVTYNGDKPIEGRLGVEPMPMYGATQGSSELGEYLNNPGT